MRRNDNERSVKSGKRAVAYSLMLGQGSELILNILFFCKLEDE
jgi:hypothetical protein